MLISCAYRLCPYRKPRPCRSSGMLVFVQDSAVPFASSYVEPGDLGGFPASVDPEVLGEEFDELAGLLAPVFARRDLRSNAMAYVRGLLEPRGAGNCLQLAQAAGREWPYCLQRLLGRSMWDEVPRGRSTRLHRRAPGRGRGDDLRRDRAAEEGHGDRGDRTAVHRYGRAHRERDCRRLHHVRHRVRPRPDRPGAVRTQALVHRLGADGAGRLPARPRLHDQAAVRQNAGRTRPRRRDQPAMGDWRRGLRAQQ
jgi:hypothetical protein